MSYSINVAKKTGKQYPPATFYARVELGNIHPDMAKEKAVEIAAIFGDQYVFRLERKETCHHSVEFQQGEEVQSV